MLTLDNNRPLYIVGGGPSLKDFKWDFLDDKQVIVLNNAYKTVKNPLCMYYHDRRFYNWFKEDLDNLPYRIYTTEPPLNIRPANIVYFKKLQTQQPDLDTLIYEDPMFDQPDNYLACYRNAGAAGISLARKLFPNVCEIRLLGYDQTLDPDTKDTNWHNDYNIKFLNPNIYNRFRWEVECAAGACRYNNINVTNYNIHNNITNAYYYELESVYTASDIAVPFKYNPPKY